MSEGQEFTQEEMNKALFAQLVMMFATSTLQHLGRVPNPGSQETHVDLEAAQTTIDLLDMLALKTKGNLEAEEEQMMQETVSSLKMHYVEVQKQGGQPEQPQEPPAGEPAPGEPEEPPIETPPGGAPSNGDDDGDDKRKFHKSYE